MERLHRQVERQPQYQKVSLMMAKNEKVYDGKTDDQLRADLNLPFVEKQKPKYIILLSGC